MRVLYHNRTRLDAAVEAELGAAYVSKAELLAQSDFISLHCPLTGETEHAFGEAEFEAMKDTACLINTARGPVVDEKALAKALRTGELFGAGLDVFEFEPHVLKEIMACPNAVLLPHLGSASRQTRANMAETAARNIIARLNGDAPPNCVNPDSLER
jgi:glyoxylate reductase